MADPANAKKSLVASMMQFLTEQLEDASLNDDAKESIEVALQCLETAFNINPIDGSLPSKKPLLEIFTAHLQNEPETKPTISDEDKAKADVFKNEGNELMKNGNFKEALESYTKAIQIDATNAIYFCNRAAAHSKLENHQAALEDCKVAIKHDPNYSKAYCRMGLAYVKLKDHQRARDSYKKAVELDPSESNRSNLDLAEKQLQEQQAQFNQGFNIGNLFNNPEMMNLATKMMSDPNMQNMFSNLMGSSLGAPAEPDVENPQGPGGINAFLQAGQHIAAEMQKSNPELVESLKKAFKKPEDEDDANPGQN